MAAAAEAPPAQQAGGYEGNETWLGPEVRRLPWLSLDVHVPPAARKAARCQKGYWLGKAARRCVAALNPHPANPVHTCTCINTAGCLAHRQAAG